jgi:hypothetical protein
MTYDEIIKRLESIQRINVDVSGFRCEAIDDLIEDLKKAQDNLVEVKVNLEDANKWLKDLK